MLNKWKRLGIVMIGSSFYYNGKQQKFLNNTYPIQFLIGTPDIN